VQVSHAKHRRRARPTPGLDGWLSKTFKKIIKPVVHIGAAIATGGASIPLSASIISAERQKKAMNQMAAEQAALDQAAVFQNPASAPVPAPDFAGATTQATGVRTLMPIRSSGSAATAVASAALGGAVLAAVLIKLRN